MSDIEKLQQMIDESRSIVFFGGAGVSTESGVPDFRSADGLYNQKYSLSPETILSRTFFDRHTEEFFDFYRDRMLFPDAKPNSAHKKLAELERAGKLRAVITQNIDGLHQSAGSTSVLELHGSVLRNKCISCAKRFDGMETVLNSTGVPRCDCGGIIKPLVVLYEEMLDEHVWQGAIDAICAADMIIVAGTSLVVYPAAGLLQYFRGKYLVQINKSQTSLSSRSTLSISANVGGVLGKIKVQK